MNKKKKMKMEKQDANIFKIIIKEKITFEILKILQNKIMKIIKIEIDINMLSELLLYNNYKINFINKEKILQIWVL